MTSGSKWEETDGIHSRSRTTKLGGGTWQAITGPDSYGMENKRNRKPAENWGKSGMKDCWPLECQATIESRSYRTISLTL